MGYGAYICVEGQSGPTCVSDSDKKWADSRWQEVVEMLQIDAVRAASVGDFRLPNQSGVIRVEDTQREQASSSGDVLVQRQRASHGSRPRRRKRMNSPDTMRSSRRRRTFRRREMRSCGKATRPPRQDRGMSGQ